MQESADSITFESPKGFIVFDGVNGAGKTTLQNALAEYIQKKGREVLCTREPGDSPLGKLLRPIILSPPEGGLEPLTEMFLFSADRREHIAKTIEPALKEGKIVLCDRYYYSTAAFQGFGREMDLQTVFTINNIAIDDCLPDLVFILDLPPEEGLKRTQKRQDAGGGEHDSFEQEALAFHTRLREGFLEIAASYKESFVVLDARASAEEVFSQAVVAVDRWLDAMYPA